MLWMYPRQTSGCCYRRRMWKLTGILWAHSPVLLRSHPVWIIGELFLIAQGKSVQQDAAVYIRSSRITRWTLTAHLMAWGTFEVQTSVLSKSQLFWPPGSLVCVFVVCARDNVWVHHKHGQSKGNIMSFVNATELTASKGQGLRPGKGWGFRSFKQCSWMICQYWFSHLPGLRIKGTFLPAQLQLCKRHHSLYR